uniref:Uncharacterized protein n=1 Tax=Leptocylindrus danicus TaxID=163516 RepID=A0A7S2KUE9_9STRA|mmetsp:Transcript_26250/g.39056  ORF Transcript_26250/g.39056 Transcript_26250/m.39056 type:complete len:113 (+) Transcript_26250:137-475(+)
MTSSLAYEYGGATRRYAIQCIHELQSVLLHNEECWILSFPPNKPNNLCLSDESLSLQSINSGTRTIHITKQWEEHLFYEYRSICATSETEERMITIYFGSCRIVLYLQMKIV